MLFSNEPDRTRRDGRRSVADLLSAVDVLAGILVIDREGDIVAGRLVVGLLIAVAVIVVAMAVAVAVAGLGSRGAGGQSGGGESESDEGVAHGLSLIHI